MMSEVESIMLLYPVQIEGGGVPHIRVVAEPGRKKALKEPWW